MRAGSGAGAATRARPSSSTPAAAGRFVLRDLRKNFGRNAVLRGIDLTIEAGTIVALMGANGAGKSTLVKIIAGVHDASAGQMLCDGRQYRPTSPSDALRAGIVIVHQAINDNVVLDMDLLENLLIDEICQGRSMFFRRSAMAEKAREMARRVGLDIPLNRRVADISLADRQLVAIARALSHDPKLLILDEPTSALSDAEAERLFGVLEALRDRGVATLYISHRMSDIRRLASRVLTLRDGQITGDFAAPIDYSAAVHGMLGRSLGAAEIEPKPAGASVLSLRGLQTGPRVPPIDLDIHEGQVTAIVGLVGAGKSELAECIYGVRQPTAGTMRLDGKDYVPASPIRAVRSGIFMAAEDRGGGSIVGDFDVTRNITLPFLGAFTAATFLRRGAERRHARRSIEDLAIVTPGETAPIGALSGGNQQKVVLARWLTGKARLLILDEPFQGVDIAARQDIGRKLRRTADGRATLLLFADPDEAIEIADRIVVLNNGAVVADLSDPPFDRQMIVSSLSQSHDRRHAA
ncbi:sugar ABC transporter ATP-binding protein [Fulvimarina endophytica]|uniref:Autoinducer 2 import ATP-binding protein LsrA n=1 Tax=Fulvimarina endophytica TaxID=2293836 RepID=A0A371X9T1_9HYPH|nr:sugar ABC transporter ATP-binding protein [Fulvimarina endophytica]RFC65952.1 sugar ABC transporter ATP-binding protein [Fulvimarina endophytica]